MATSLLGLSLSPGIVGSLKVEYFHFSLSWSTSLGTKGNGMSFLLNGLLIVKVKSIISLRAIFEAY